MILENFLNKAKKYLLNVYLEVIVYTFIFCLVATALFIMYYAVQLPNHKNLKQYEPPITTRLYSENDKLLKEYAKEKRNYIPIQEVPAIVKNAFIAAEDADFYTNPGISIKSMFNAAVQGGLSFFTGNRVRGASTITQQVAKNFLLTNERTLTRKIKEILIAIRLTNDFSKDEILQLYLNQIYFGNRSYGIASAALNYFNKSLDEITIEEAALLASLPKAPSQLDPTKGDTGILDRRNWIINRLEDLKYITKEESQKAKETPIKLNSKEQKYAANADFFSEEVRKQMAKIYGQEKVETEGYIVETTLKPELQILADKYLKQGIEEYDRRHGFRGAIGNIAGEINFKTNWGDLINNFKIEKKYRAEWNKAVVLEINKEQDIIVIGVKKINNDEDFSEDLENDTYVQVSKDDKILIMGYIPFEHVKWAKKYIDVDTTGKEPKKITDLELQIGDVIIVEKTDKPNQYALKQIPEVNGALLAIEPQTGNVVAMMGGYIDSITDFNRATQAERQPGSTMKPFAYLAALENGFTPASVIIDEEITMMSEEGVAPYKPKNNEGEGIFFGPTTLRVGLEKSRNITTIRMAGEVGLKKIVDLIKRFDISSEPRMEYSIVLGSVETKLIKMVRGYAMFVNGGKIIEPKYIQKIQDRNGKIIFRDEKRECPDCIVDENVPFKEIVVPNFPDDREQIIDSASAYQITNMLTGVVQSGTAWRAKQISAPIGAKTGTTNEGKDSWFVGFSPNLAVGVYIGFDKPELLGRNEFGANLAGPIFINFMKDAVKKYSSIPFKVPDSVKLLQIDKTTGYYPGANSDSKNIVTEAFKLDEEPKPLETDSIDKTIDELDRMLNEQMFTPQITINENANKRKESEAEVQRQEDEDIEIIME